MHLKLPQLKAVLHPPPFLHSSLRLDQGPAQREASLGLGSSY